MRNEDGFTLVELLVALVIGMVILLAGVQALDSFSVSSAKVTARTDTTQRGRLYMDLLTRTLRSQVCQGPGQPSVIAGTATSITVVTDFSDGTGLPDKRTITYDAARRRLSELRFKGVSRNVTTGAVTFATTGAAGPSLAGVGPNGTTSIFRYFTYGTTSPPKPDSQLPGTLTAGDLPKVSRISIAFRVGPATGTDNASSSSVVESRVLLRSVDPSDPAPLPRCL